MYMRGTARYQLYAKEISLEGAGALYERFLASEDRAGRDGNVCTGVQAANSGFYPQAGSCDCAYGSGRAGYKKYFTADVILICRLFCIRHLYREKEQQTVLYVESICWIRQSVDVIIVGRGGGSIEDLWAFNEEKVARAIFECRTPIISAVGHETDFTIADFVADLRAPTPSAAAELAVADFRQILQNIAGLRDRMQKAMQRRAELGRAQLMQYQMRFQYLNPEAKLRDNRQRLADLDELLRRAMKNRIAEETTYAWNLSGTIQRTVSFV